MWHSLGYNEDGEDIALAPAWCPLRHAPLVLRFGPAKAERERDEARAERDCARTELEHARSTSDYLLEQVNRLRDGEEVLRAEVEALKYPRAYIPPGEERSLALSAIMISQAETEIRALRAEVEMLRGVGCREAKAGEPESGPCGVCLKCAEERGAKWALDAAHKEVVWAVDQDRANINVRSLTALEVCDFARKYEP
jgi:hypothetical protein